MRCKRLGNLCRHEGGDTPSLARGPKGANPSAMRVAGSGHVQVLNKVVLRLTWESLSQVRKYLLVQYLLVS